MTILAVNQLNVSYKNKKNAVANVSFCLKKGETLGIVGESGSGKSTLALALLRLLPKGSFSIQGAAFFNDNNLIEIPEKEMQKVRGKKIGFIFQDALAALNPTMTVGKQILEVILQHEHVSSAEAKRRTIELMSKLGIDDAQRRYGEYPFQYSGGMRQRAVIAIAMACSPQLIIADEPTTALDESIQKEILSLLKTLQQETGMSLLLISHDFGVVAQMCDEVLVMKNGECVEKGTVKGLLENPTHSYTRQLLESARYSGALA